MKAAQYLCALRDSKREAGRYRNGSPAGDSVVKQASFRLTSAGFADQEKIHWSKNTRLATFCQRIRPPV